MIAAKRGECSKTKGEDYEWELHFDKGYCNEQEEYLPIPKKEEEEETPNPEYEYGIPTTSHPSLEVRLRNSSPNGFLNQSNNNRGNRRQGIPTKQAIPRMNIIIGNDIKLTIFNINGLEDPKQHWFLCEDMWTI